MPDKLNWPFFFVTNIFIWHVICVWLLIIRFYIIWFFAFLRRSSNAMQKQITEKVFILIVQYFFLSSELFGQFHRDYNLNSSLKFLLRIWVFFCLLLKSFWSILNNANKNCPFYFEWIFHILFIGIIFNEPKHANKICGIEIFSSSFSDHHSNPIVY